MYYLKFGSSRNYIVFLHGWGADMSSFLWLKDYFISDYSLIFLDFDGFGKSEEPSEVMDVSSYVSNLKEILNNFKIDNLIIVGHSFGGRVAIKFLFNYQTIFNSVKLCLIDSAGILPKRGIKYKLKVREYKNLKKKIENNPQLKDRLKNYGSDDYKNLSPIMQQSFINIVNEDLSCYAKFIKCNTIIVWGENDKETKIYMAKKLKRLIKGSKLYILKNTGHFSFLENKEDFLIILDSFLKNL